MKHLIVLAVAFVLSISSSFAAAPPKIPHIVFDVPMTEDTVRIAQKVLQSLPPATTAAVLVEINSPGGSVDAGFRLAKTIEASKVPVICLVDGEAASMALYVLQSCHVRLMTDRSVLMWHEPSFYVRGFGGPQSDWETASKNALESLRALTKAMNRHVCHRTDISYQELAGHVAGGREWWMDADEAKARKVVDYAVPSVDEAKALILDLL